MENAIHARNLLIHHFVHFALFHKFFLRDLISVFVNFAPLQSCISLHDFTRHWLGYMSANASLHPWKEVQFQLIMLDQTALCRFKSSRGVHQLWCKSFRVSCQFPVHDEPFPPFVVQISRDPSLILWWQSAIIHSQEEHIPFLSNRFGFNNRKWLSESASPWPTGQSKRDR